MNISGHWLRRGVSSFFFFWCELKIGKVSWCEKLHVVKGWLCAAVQTGVSKRFVNCLHLTVLQLNSCASERFV